MLSGLLVMAICAGWVWYFYARCEPQYSAWLGRCLGVSLELTYRGYSATGGMGWLHRLGAVLLADASLLLLLLGPFFALLLLWWR